MLVGLKKAIVEEMKKSHWFTAKEIAEKMNVSAVTVNRALEDGVEDKEIRIVGIKGRKYLCEEYKIEATVIGSAISSISEKDGLIYLNGTERVIVYEKDNKGKYECKYKEVPSEVVISKLALEDIAEALNSEVPFF